MCCIVSRVVQNEGEGFRPVDSILLMASTVKVCNFTDWASTTGIQYTPSAGNKVIRELTTNYSLFQILRSINTLKFM